jgi:hypothetical protein
MAKGKMTKGKMGKGEMAKIGGEMAKGELGKGEMGINRAFPIRTDCVTIFLNVVAIKVVPSDGIGILPLICAWPPRGCTI